MMNISRMTGGLCIVLLFGCHSDISTIRKSCLPVDRAASVSPDYTGLMLPPNIAPLNFRIREPGIRFGAHISSSLGGPVTIISRQPSVRFPQKKWNRLLEQNRGNPLRIDLFVQDSTGRWHTFKPIIDTVACESIDRYVTFRTLSFLYNFSRDVRIYERNLESFAEKQLINSTDFSWGCANCHMPKTNDPHTFVVQMRSENFGSAMLLANDGALTKIGSRFGYPAWHPHGGPVAFAVYDVRQCFHSATGNFIDVYDNASDIVLYDVRKKTTSVCPELMQKRTLETWPVWSPDGRHLYFCSGRVLWNGVDRVPPENFDSLRYDLMRIAYRQSDGTWGPADTVLSSAQTGLSISQPRISPDGRFLLFCMHNYGAYPHTQKNSDLYLMEIASKTYRKLDINSGEAESWHGWSANGKWILFSSKRNGGFFTRICFSYIDSSGIAHKPFIMPQHDPRHYDSFIKSYNVPEFATGPVDFNERQFLKSIRSPAEVSVPLPAANGASDLPQNPLFQ